ncbi:MAG: 2-amino-4-hydroxy-6-hydroxymethyldihydropteridine diphosphokinase, partial [Spirochaetaceae bacterium]
KNAPRTIDLDIILYGDEVYVSDDLVIPDPGLMKYPFVALPVLELVGDIVIPGTNSHLASLFPGNPDSYGFTQQEELTAYCIKATGT